MGAGEQIVLCHSLETGPFTEYLNKVKQQQQQQRQAEQLPLAEPERQPALHRAHLHASQDNVQKVPSTSISTTTSHHLHESIKCVLNWMDANPAPGQGQQHNNNTTRDGESVADYAPLPDLIPYRVGSERLAISNGTTYPQLPQGRVESPSTQPERNHNLVNSLLSSAFREHSPTLCRLKETLNNYYSENCIFGQEIAALPVSSRRPLHLLNSSGIAFADTISTAAVSAIANLTSTTTTTTSAVPTELGGLFGNDSIMDDSLNQPHAAGPPLTYHWNFLFFVIIFIIAGGLGNILVCLAIALDRKLQNVTNYFLLSLAIADLLVSLFVMPLGAIPTFLGKRP